MGAILVVAMMIAPAVTAYLLARWLDSSIAAAMTTVSGALFVLALLFAPRTGLVAGRWPGEPCGGWTHSWTFNGHGVHGVHRF